MKDGRHFYILVLVFVLVISMGSYFYHHVEGWSYVDSVYFVSMTVTTVGYGDFVPTTDVGKIFTIFFSFFGVAMALYLFSIFGSKIFKRHLSQKLKNIKKVEGKDLKKSFKRKK